MKVIASFLSGAGLTLFLISLLKQYNMQFPACHSTCSIKNCRKRKNSGNDKFPESFVCLTFLIIACCTAELCGRL